MFFASFKLYFANVDGMVRKMYRAHLRKTPARITVIKRKKLEKIKNCVRGEYVCI